ncbi:MAG: hypothetical protein MJE68_10385 [Proteobacteria bacterium]|nr:hypothetical protein [Pseudomonadota bacterium]
MGKGYVTYEERMARYSKEERREVERGSLRTGSEIVGLNDTPDARRILKKRYSKDERLTVMLGMARREARMAEGMPIGNDPLDEGYDGFEINTSYRDLLDVFSKKQQRAIERGARLLQARYAGLPAKYKTRKGGAYFVVPDDAEPETFNAYLETLPKEEQRALLRRIEGKADRNIVASRKKTEARDSVADAPVPPTKPVPSDNIYMSAKGK